MVKAIAPQKRERLEARVTAEQKSFFQHAAALEGLSLTDFMVNHLIDAAHEAVGKHAVLTLSTRDAARFIAELTDPAEPNERLLEAARRHRELISE